MPHVKVLGILNNNMVKKVIEIIFDWQLIVFLIKALLQFEIIKFIFALSSK